MTKEQEEAIEILNKFMNNEMQRDKLERSRDGGWKIGDIYKHLELNPALEIILSMLQEQQEENKKKDKIIDLMAEIFYKRFKAELLLEYGFESEEQLKQCFERKVEDVKN